MNMDEVVTINLKKVATVSVSLLALTLSGLVFFAMFGPEGCGPSDEERQLLATLNSLEAIYSKGGHVETVELHRDEDDDVGVYRYEAAILNDEGVAIGRLRGRRVDGFATMKPRIKWYKTPGVAEE